MEVEADLPHMIGCSGPGRGLGATDVGQYTRCSKEKTDNKNKDILVCERKGQFCTHPTNPTPFFSSKIFTVSLERT
jgi:hypothetical protein